MHCICTTNKNCTFYRIVCKLRGKRGADEKSKEWLESFQRIISVTEKNLLGNYGGVYYLPDPSSKEVAQP